MVCVLQGYGRNSPVTETAIEAKAANEPKPTSERQKINSEEAPKPATPIPTLHVNQGVYLNKVHEIWTDTSIRTSFDYLEFLKASINTFQAYAELKSRHMESVEAMVPADGKRAKDEGIKVKLDIFL